MENPKVQMCLAQKRAFEALGTGVQVGSILRLWGGIGKSPFSGFMSSFVTRRMSGGSQDDE
jgi:hypothetical protein